MPFFPKSFSTQFTFQRTRNTSIILSVMAIMIFSTLHSALRDNAVVNVPGPATNGKTTGTMVAPPCVPSLRNNSMLKVISIANAKRTNEPAIAKEAISVLKSLSRASPAKRNVIKIISEIIVAFPGCTFFPVLLRFTIMGIEPVMSITANSTINAVKISCRFRFSITVFRQLKYIKHLLSKDKKGLSIWKCFNEKMDAEKEDMIYPLYDIKK